MGNGTPRVKKVKPMVSRHKNTQNVLLEDMSAHFYRAVNPSRAQEIMDSRMIQEDHHAISNLSERFINHEFNPNKYVQSLGKKDEANEIG